MKQLEKIFVDPEVQDAPLTRRTIENAPGIPVEYTTLEQLLNREAEHDPIGTAKRSLLITADRGSQLKRCPGTRGLICCNYFVINQGIGCPFDCSYCFLQDFSNLPSILVYANTTAIFAEVKQFTAARPNGFFRIGTGEMSDSLALDHLTEFSTEIVPFFAELDNAILELKTKSDNVTNLTGLDHCGNTVISWSLNPPEIIASDEPGSATLDQRLHSAARVAAAGYPLAFHFDPLIEYPGWQEGYRLVINRLREAVDPQQIKWISLGSFRYRPSMKKVMDLRFPASRLTAGEHLLSPDGKMRYYAPARAALYSRIIEQLHEWYPGLFLYFCMESSRMWQDVMKKDPGTMAGVDKLFRCALQR